jgi:hypothetical protein
MKSSDEVRIGATDTNGTDDLFEAAVQIQHKLVGVRQVPVQAFE